MNPTVTAPTPAKNDFTDLVNLFAELTDASGEMDKLETSLNQDHLANVRLHIDTYKALQARLGAAEAAISAIAQRNPAWFEEKKTVDTPFGEVKRTTSTSLVIADEAATIALIRAAGRADDFLVMTTSVRREAIETLEDHELAKLGVRREVKHNFKPAPARLDLGKAVKAADKGPTAVKKAARAAAAAHA